MFTCALCFPTGIQTQNKILLSLLLVTFFMNNLNNKGITGYQMQHGSVYPNAVITMFRTYKNGTLFFFFAA